MKFKVIKGITHIILDKNDKVCLTTKKDDDKKIIELSNTSKGIDISGDSSLINKISGEGMLEKIYIPPIASSEEIIAECDTWIEMFKNLHDKFSSLVLTDEYKSRSIYMYLSFGIFFSTDDSKGQTIDLGLKSYSSNVSEGMSIDLEDKDSDIYNYLMASILDYYLNKNYATTLVDYQTNWNQCLGSELNSPRQNNILANLVALMKKNKTRDIVTALLETHNLGMSANQIIANLKAQITSRPMPKSLIESIEYSKRQHDIISTQPNGESRVRKQDPNLI